MFIFYYKASKSFQVLLTKLAAYSYCSYTCKCVSDFVKKCQIPDCVMISLLVK